jgi:hypothetical protein
MAGTAMTRTPMIRTPMIRTIDVFMLCALIAAAAWTFKVKHDSERAMERVAKLEQQIQAEREAIDILHADWSLLNSPDRLQRLIDRHAEELGLEPLRPERIIAIEDVPLRTRPTEAQEKRAFSDAIGADSVMTGSVQPQPPAGEGGLQRTELPPLEQRQ